MLEKAAPTVGIDKTNVDGSKLKLKPVVNLNWLTPANKFTTLNDIKLKESSTLFVPVKG